MFFCNTLLCFSSKFHIFRVGARLEIMFFHLAKISTTLHLNGSNLNLKTTLKANADRQWPISFLVKRRKLKEEI